ncbi:MAG: 2-hydroxyglutaryl-CoA dehydratase [Acidobacteria bacterium]|nr:2-hydroxyglutaryl-CoA dehydratase [Acidobacteriota bacterium]
MNYVVGLDVGTRMTRALLLDLHGRVQARCQRETGARLETAAQAVLDELLQQQELKAEDIAYIASTGYGRYRVPFRQTQITEMTCHAVGALWLFAGTRTVLDIGAMNSRALRVAESGRVVAFRMNDRCASGAGRFLERVARSLEVELEQIGELSLRSQDPQPISSICAVLAESEVINHVTAGKAVEDILRGAHNSIAERLVALVRQVGAQPEITLTGGVTKNAGMVRALEERLGVRLNVSVHSEYAGALGAALLARQRWQRLQNSTGSAPQRQAAARNPGTLEAKEESHGHRDDAGRGCCVECLGGHGSCHSAVGARPGPPTDSVSQIGGKGKAGG